MEPTLIKK